MKPWGLLIIFVLLCQSAVSQIWSEDWEGNWPFVLSLQMAVGLAVRMRVGAGTLIRYR